MRRPESMHGFVFTTRLLRWLSRVINDFFCPRLGHNLTKFGTQIFQIPREIIKLAHVKVLHAPVQAPFFDG